MPQLVLVPNPGTPFATLANAVDRATRRCVRLLQRAEDVERRVAAGVDVDDAPDFIELVRVCSSDIEHVATLRRELSHADGDGLAGLYSPVAALLDAILAIANTGVAAGTNLAKVRGPEWLRLAAERATRAEEAWEVTCHSLQVGLHVLKPQRTFLLRPLLAETEDDYVALRRARQHHDDLYRALRALVGDGIAPDGNSAVSDDVERWESRMHPLRSALPPVAKTHRSPGYYDSHCYGRATAGRFGSRLPAPPAPQPRRR